jgi:hypothetical protein
LTIPQARKSWGKAVKIGRGPATVIGCWKWKQGQRAVSQDTRRAGIDDTLREKEWRWKPHILVGLFCLWASEF